MSSDSEEEPEQLQVRVPCDATKREGNIKNKIKKCSSLT